MCYYKLVTQLNKHSSVKWSATQTLGNWPTWIKMVPDISRGSTATLLRHGWISLRMYYRVSHFSIAGHFLLEMHRWGTGLTIGRLPINKKVTITWHSYLWDRKKLLIMIPASWITVKPALGNHPFVRLIVVTQNRWSINEGSLTGTGIVKIVSL